MSLMSKFEVSTVFVVSMVLPSLCVAAEVQSASIDEARGLISIDVAYHGCKQHSFELDLQLCRESVPVHCEAKLVDKTTDDFCDARTSSKVEIQLQSVGLTDPYYSNGVLRISGDAGSTATVILPQ